MAIKIDTAIKSLAEAIGFFIFSEYSKDETMAFINSMIDFAYKIYESTGNDKR